MPNSNVTPISGQRPLFSPGSQMSLPRFMACYVSSLHPLGLILFLEISVFQQPLNSRSKIRWTGFLVFFEAVIFTEHNRWYHTFFCLFFVLFALLNVFLKVKTNVVSVEVIYTNQPFQLNLHLTQPNWWCTHVSCKSGAPQPFEWLFGQLFLFVFWLLLCNYITFCCERTFSVAMPCFISNVFPVISSCLEKQN